MYLATSKEPNLAGVWDVGREQYETSWTGRGAWKSLNLELKD